MMERTGAERKLAGERVAFTGRLAQMSRRLATELVQRHGGSFSATVNRQTTMLVVGREGWPLRSDGRLTRKLEQARRLKRSQQSPEIVPEEGFFQRVQWELPHAQIRRTHTVAELTELLELPRRQIESWERSGLLKPAEYCDGIPCFDFRQVAAARSLRALLEAGVPSRRLVRSIRQLRAWVPDVPCVGDLLPGLMQDGRRFLYRSDNGRLVETTGQLVFEFPSEPGVATVPWTSGAGADALFEEAVRLEQEGRLEEAAGLYRRLIVEEGPDADLGFNLANVLYAQGSVQAAIERLREAVTFDPWHTDAWNNLGNFLAEQGQAHEACHAYRQAVSIEPNYADAHYGLADVLEQLGRAVEARAHWKAYLQHEQEGPWADYARTRLSVHSA